MRVIFAAMLVCSLFGCDKKKDAETKAAPTTESKTVDLDTSKPGPEAPPPPPAASGTPVDTCAFVTKDDVEKLFGNKLMADPEKQPAQGSFLGGCNYMTDKGQIANVSARPAGEFDATARKGTDVAGVGEKAKMTESGLLAQPAGKPYFLHVMVMDGGKMSDAKATELGKLAIAGAK